jgi:hypothetical protein
LDWGWSSCIRRDPRYSSGNSDGLNFELGIFPVLAFRAALVPSTPISFAFFGTLIQMAAGFLPSSDAPLASSSGIAEHLGVVEAANEKEAIAKGANNASRAWPFADDARDGRPAPAAMPPP